MKTVIKKVSSLFLSTLCFVCSAFCFTQEPPAWLSFGQSAEMSDIDSSQFHHLTEWLYKNGKTPLEYAIEKCKKYQLVIFGESHEVKDNLDLFKRIIPEAYHEAGVRNVLLEVCKVVENERVVQLIEGEKYDKELALEIARSGPWGMWRYKEYWDIFEVVWKLNKKIPDKNEHMKVIGIDVDVDLPLNWLRQRKKISDMNLRAKALHQLPLIAKRDELLAAAIEIFVLNKGEKGIVLAGANHSFTHYAQPRVNEKGQLIREWQRMGKLLYQKYRERIFQIVLYHSHPSPDSIYKGYKGEKPVFNTFIENIMSKRNNEPVGFDVLSSPFAQLRDSNSYYFHFQPLVTFSDICRGFIFLKPLNELSKCTRIDNFISDEMFEKYKAYYEARFNRTFKNAREVNEFLGK